MDVEAIVAVHHAAVRALAGLDYPPEVIDAWSPPPGEGRYRWIRAAMTGLEELWVVAEINGSVIGFGSVVPGNRELRSLYVHPRAAGRGVGTTILSRLEATALDRGVDVLQLDSSLNAERFYRGRGWKVVERGTHRLNSGREMACVKLRKTLCAAQAPAEAR